MYEEWIGHRRVTVDVITESPARRLVATIDRPHLDLRRGDALPPMWHWLYFHNEVRTEDLGADGHAPWGGFVPPIGLPRRMFAGGVTQFHRPLMIGSEAEKTETVEEVTEKTSASGQPLVFLTVRSEIADAAGPILTERQTLVYTTPATDTPPPGVADRGEWAWSRTVTPNETMLFRFSALTWNAHRIHYDAQFSISVDGHPALLVQGPLTAILLLDLWGRNSAEQPQSFSFRATRPAYVNRSLTLVGGPSGELVALDDHSAPVMAASVTGR